jgi:hypothetical protein
MNTGLKAVVAWLTLLMLSYSSLASTIYVRRKRLTTQDDCLSGIDQILCNFRTQVHTLIQNWCIARQRAHDRIRGLQDRAERISHFVRGHVDLFLWH